MGNPIVHAIFRPYSPVRSGTALHKHKAVPVCESVCCGYKANAILATKVLIISSVSGYTEVVEESDPPNSDSNASSVVGSACVSEALWDTATDTADVSGFDAPQPENIAHTMANINTHDTIRFISFS